MQTSLGGSGTLRSGDPLRTDWSPVDRELMAASLTDVTEAALILQLNGELLAWNRAFRQLVGAAGTDPVPASLYELIPAEERACWSAWLDRLLKGESIPRVRTVFQTRGGLPCGVEGSLVAVSLGEDRIVIRAQFHDRSRESRAEAARRDSEERYRTLCSLAPVGVFQTDPEGRLTYTNQRWRQLAGLHHVSEPRGVWWQVVHPDDRPRIIAMWESARRHGHEFVSEFRLLVGFGQLRWGRTRLAQRSGTDGALVSCIGTTEDITDLKRVESELAAARDAALQSARLKAQFLSNVSHEVRTPMNGVLGMLELLAETPMDAKQQRYSDIARESAAVLLRLLEDILDFSRLEAGRFRLERAPMDPGHLLGEICLLHRPKAEARHIQLIHQVDPRLPGPLMGDSVRLHQVLGNLIGNAIKFTDRGAVTASCTLLSADARRCILRFEVSDTGIGIPAEALTRLFQPFYQVDGDLTRRHGGTGLGLAIVRQLVELMGGEVKVESTPGTGSRFWFDLPFEPAPREIPPMTATTLPRPA
jgi:PAS domain S-box-containing protein